MAPPPSSISPQAASTPAPPPPPLSVGRPRRTPKSSLSPASSLSTPPVDSFTSSSPNPSATTPHTPDLSTIESSAATTPGSSRPRRQPKRSRALDDDLGDYHLQRAIESARRRSLAEAPPRPRPSELVVAVNASGGVITTVKDWTEKGRRRSAIQPRKSPSSSNVGSPLARTEPVVGSPVEETPKAMEEKSKPAKTVERVVSTRKARSVVLMAKAAAVAAAEERRERMEDDYILKGPRNSDSEAPWTPSNYPNIPTQPISSQELDEISQHRSLTPSEASSRVAGPGIHDLRPLSQEMIDAGGSLRPGLDKLYRVTCRSLPVLVAVCGRKTTSGPPSP
ncbi:hypothetical protein DFS34DRAFT_652441 [Phlyctochytrium arcticum]|nr:hypothetical protein DFS34DRAFT_652441 [Phlyctochytrium arcticum]